MAPASGGVREADAGAACPPLLRRPTALWSRLEISAPANASLWTMRPLAQKRGPSVGGAGAVGSKRSGRVGGNTGRHVSTRHIATCSRPSPSFVMIFVKSNLSVFPISACVTRERLSNCPSALRLKPADCAELILPRQAWSIRRPIGATPPYQADSRLSPLPSGNPRLPFGSRVQSVRP